MDMVEVGLVMVKAGLVMIKAGLVMMEVYAQGSCSRFTIKVPSGSIPISS